MSGLIVSVRSADEAKAALRGGADLIDVKEPSRGPLGRADADVIKAVVATVGGRVPVSAALGELHDLADQPWPSRALGLMFVKCGLAQCAESTNTTLLSSWLILNPVLVPAAYADFQRSGSPSPELLCQIACSIRYPAFLIDTAVKDGSSLLDWIEPAVLARIRLELADAGVRVAFAGSLDVDRIRQLLPLAPDWFAVRGAVCEGGRQGTVSAERVRELKEVIAAGSVPVAAD